MATHVVIDDGAVTGDYRPEKGSFRRKPGCAACGLDAELCERYPTCKGRRVFSIAFHDQKTNGRRYKRRKQERSSRR